MQVLIHNALHDCADAVEKELQNNFLDSDSRYDIIQKACRYSLMAGGKRIRPFLVLEFSRLFGGDQQIALQLGCALEMIHTYSLIHDDLPCMDNDDLRRGKPTNHKVFGEDIALLAGDALLTEAFAVASSEQIPDAMARNAVAILAANAGSRGMIGGQILDLAAEKERPDFDTLLFTHEKKTTALIEAACLLGCCSAGIFDSASTQIKAAKAYAHGIGLSFQIVDDLLDQFGDTATLGKNTGSDQENGKTTFLSFMNADEARSYAATLTQEAKTALASFDNSETLIALADALLTRDN